LVEWARARIVDGTSQDAHRRLKQMNGVSDKIASFFLRDVALYFRQSPRVHRELLQPVDTWIRYVASHLCGRKGQCDTWYARYIATHADAPEMANAGIWYFCTNVAHSARWVVGDALNNRRRLNQLVDAHLDQLRDDAVAARQFRTGWSPRE
jgi:hypothetical protein